METEIILRRKISQIQTNIACVIRYVDSGRGGIRKVINIVQSLTLNCYAAQLPSEFSVPLIYQGRMLGFQIKDDSTSRCYKV